MELSQRVEIPLGLVQVWQSLNDPVILKQCLPGCEVFEPIGDSKFNITLLAKVGPVLFLDGGPGLVRELKTRGIRVFLNLKWHDIPHSVACAVRQAASLGVDLATVHGLGGRAMLAAAVQASGAMKIAAVSVLTSHSASDYWEAVGRDGADDLVREVVRLSRVAVDTGVHAIVSSASEATAVREAVGTEPWIVVPGIRLAAGAAGGAYDDQSRVAGPRAAVKAGATHLVIGRPIIRANSPGSVYESIWDDVR